MHKPVNGLKTSAVLVNRRHFWRTDGAPAGGRHLLGACRPTSEWDPKPGREATPLELRVLKSVYTAQVEVFFLRSAVLPSASNPA